MIQKLFLALAACAILAVGPAGDVMAQPGGGGGGGRQGGFGGGQGGFGGGRGGFGGGGRGGFGQRTPPGPPVEVPDVVKIDLPTQAEVDKANEMLSKVVEDSELLQKFSSQLKIEMPGENPCIRPTPGVRGGRHDAFVEIADQGGIDVLFQGDSITDWWSQPAERGGGDAVLEENFGDLKLANFGVAGDTTQGILWGMQNGEVGKLDPKAIMLMIGTNSTGGSSGAQIAEGVGGVILKMREDFPNAKILLLAIFPRGGGPDDRNRQKCEDANEIIAKLHDGEHVFYKNINDKFLKEDGSLIGFRPDNLHPNEEGYKIWAAAVAPTLKSWVE